MTEPKEPWQMPWQTKGIIIGVCVCQMTVVLSIVAFLYLSVAIYIPSYRAINSGYDPIAITCETTELNLMNNCSWASCGEWCLTKTSGFCPQITVRARQNGSELIVENCSRLSTNSCPQANFESFKRYNCNHDYTCAFLTGLFNCSLGHCANMSEQLLCPVKGKSDGSFVNSVKDNLKLNGYFDCTNATCRQVTLFDDCERKFCPKITTVGVNTFLMYDDSLYTGECQRALSLTKSKGKSAPEWTEPQEVWTEEKSKGYLLASCSKVERVGTSLIASDCINGSVLPESKMPTPFVNFSVFWSVYAKSLAELDPKGEYIPWQKNLTIHEQSKLFINLEGCVNTLKGECKMFAQTHGRDGRNRTAFSRFPCYHKPDDPKMVITRFNLDQTRFELVLSVVVPTVLFVISFTVLTIVTKAVVVDERSMLICALLKKSKSNRSNGEEEEELKMGLNSKEGNHDS